MRLKNTSKRFLTKKFYAYFKIGKGGMMKEEMRFPKSSFLRGLVFLFPLLIGLILSSCHTQKPPPPDENHYDPRNISRTETDSYGPSIAVGPDGTVYVAWMDGGHGEYEKSHIYFRYKPQGGDWSDIEILSDTSVDSWAPHLACDPFGNVHLVWEEHDPDFEHAKIYYRMRKPSGEWTGIEVLSLGVALQPRIAVDPSGTVHVVWNSENGGGMQYREKALGGTWSQVETGPAYITNPAICADAEGGVHVVFESLNEEIFYLYRSPGGPWSEPVNVSESPQFYSWFANVTVSPEGYPYVLWTEGDSRVFYRKRIDTLWTEADTIPGTRGHGKPRTKHLFFYGEKKYLLWGDGWFEIYLGQTEGELKDGLDVEMPFDPPGSPYPDAVLDEGKGVIHVVWSAQTEGGNWEVFYDVVSLK